MMAPIPYLPTTMKPKSTKERPFWQVPLIGLAAGLGLSLLAVMPMLTPSQGPPPQPEESLPATQPEPPAAEPTRLRAASDLSRSERLWVAGAMAGSGCQVTRGKASEDVARAAYEGTVTAKGIDPRSTWNDEELKQMSRRIFVEMCR